MSVNTNSRQKSLQPYTPRFLEVDYHSTPCVPQSDFACDYVQCQDIVYPHCEYPWDHRFQRLFRSQTGGPVSLVNLRREDFPEGADLPPWITCQSVNQIYWNESVTVTMECPHGTVGEPVTVTVPAGLYQGNTQEEANRAALLAGEAEASAGLECEETEIDLLLGGNADNPLYRTALMLIDDPDSVAPYVREKVLVAVNGEVQEKWLYTCPNQVGVPAVGWEGTPTQAVIIPNGDGSYAMASRSLLARFGESPYPDLYPLATPFNVLAGRDSSAESGNAFEGFISPSPKDGIFNYYNLRSFKFWIRWETGGNEYYDEGECVNIQPLNNGIWGQSNVVLFNEERAGQGFTYRIRATLTNHFGLYQVPVSGFSIRQRLAIWIDSFSNSPSGFSNNLLGLLMTYPESLSASTYRFENIGSHQYVRSIHSPQPESQKFIMQFAAAPSPAANVIDFGFTDIQFWEYPQS